MIHSASNINEPNAPPKSVNLSKARTGIDSHAIMRIKDLDLRAKFVVEGFLQGLHRSPYHGFSVEFTEYRQYTPGDDPRYLDWRLYARSDRYYIKRFEDETNLRCHLLVDASRSMQFSSISHTKMDYARTLAATLAYFLSMQRDAVGAVTFHDQIADYVPARFRPGQVRRVFAALEKTVVGTGTDLSVPLERIASLMTKRGLLILVSDLLADLSELKNDLAALRAYGHDIMIFQILDPAEIMFPFQDASRFYDLESDSQYFVNPVSARDIYLKRLAQHLETVQKISESLGIDYRLLQTDQPLATALFDLLNARKRQLQGSSRTRGRRGR